ncbi:integrative conjugative element protein, RAQPRD family [Xylophilus sp. ASV27]|uniref:integrative conjugative element protein, RAQPRD family n=1 Tax=Xylophilus sp. ASV27 TaxID=2795129 RepID=UPI0018ED9602|nr:RAQPRD family integrative conjugative element protein [Xylophilus sp. ASV27]
MKPTRMPRRIFAWIVTGLLATTAAAWAAGTDDELERERLSRIAAEIEQVQAMVAEAERSAPTGQRVKFRYDWLQRDLEMLRQGVISHVDAPRQPRPVAPLRGDYRQ